VYLEWQITKTFTATDVEAVKLARNYNKEIRMQQRTFSDNK